MKSVIAWLAGVLCAIYLMNPTGGMYELVADRIPLAGNLDEAVACLILFGSVRHFGINLLAFFSPAGGRV
ncbi:MAG: DUF1232 domain-containing protein [Planctomycetota bacterium]|nr:DUF1232 domain-containing protein [Planctomycetota bacterium]